MLCNGPNQSHYFHRSPAVCFLCSNSAQSSTKQQPVGNDEATRDYIKEAVPYSVTHQEAPTALSDEVVSWPSQPWHPAHQDTTSLLYDYFLSRKKKKLQYKLIFTVYKNANTRHGNTPAFWQFHSNFTCHWISFAVLVRHWTIVHTSPINPIFKYSLLAVSEKPSLLNSRLFPQVSSLDNLLTGSLWGRIGF